MSLALIALIGCHKGSEADAAPDAGRVSTDLQLAFLPPREKTTGPSPVLVLLHGFGSNERDLLALAPSLDPRLALYSLRAPLVMGPQSFAWFNLNSGPGEAEAARTSVVRFLQRLRQRPEVDPSRVYLLGFSQGAMLALSVALTEPDLIRGAVVVSGRTLPELAARARPVGDPPHVLLMHGREDARIPFAQAVESEAVLRRAGFAPDLRAYQGGHDITAAMRQDLGAWLTAELSAAK